MGSLMNNPDSEFEAVWQALAKRDFTKARQLLDEMPADIAATSEARRAAARAAWLQGFPEATKVILIEATKDHPDDIPLVTDVALLYLDVGHAKTALDILNEVIKRQPDLKEATIARYGALVALGRTPEARKMLKAALDKNLAEGGKVPSWKPLLSCFTPWI